jgi:hypothetical protein
LERYLMDLSRGATVKRANWIHDGIVLLVLLMGCSREDSPPPAGPFIEPILDSSDLVILSARFASPPLLPFASDGDLWLSTWGSDDMLYMCWGDGAGPGQSRDSALFSTDAGVAALEGPVLAFSNVSNNYECVRGIHVPDGIAWGIGMAEDDKPSSMLYLNERLYFAGHTPMGDPNYGYIAYSDDKGITWTEVPNSPWTLANESPFRILMFINMGQAYELNTDGYVYAFGIGKEWSWLSGQARLCRVRTGQVADYDAYEYFSGPDAMDLPRWSADQEDAIPLEDLNLFGIGSAMYHDGSQHFLMYGAAGLFAAPDPWGPWMEVQFENSEYDDLWEGGYAPGLIAKDAGPDYFYFTMAGQDSVINYFCHMGKIELNLALLLQ